MIVNQFHENFISCNKPVCWFGVDSRSLPAIFIILWFLLWSRDPRPLRCPRPPCRPWFPWPEVKKSTEPATNALALELVLGKLWAKFDKFENLLWLLTDSTWLLVVDVLPASEDVFVWSKSGPTSAISRNFWIYNNILKINSIKNKIFREIPHLFHLDSDAIIV